MRGREACAALLLATGVVSTGCAAGDTPTDGGDAPGSNEPPTLTITAPAAGTEVVEGATLSFTATASDPEDGSLTASISWTSNLDGAMGSGGQVTATLSLGDHTVTASVTDSGGRTAQATLAVGVTPDLAPTVTITAPADGATLSAGIVVTLSAVAADEVDGDLTAGIVWTSSLDGALGTGGSIPVSLTPGAHILTAGVADSRGQTASASVSVTAEAAPVQWASIDAGRTHTCGVTTAGVGYCWGDNTVGALGLGYASSTDVLEPAPVAGGLTWASITAGNDHTCGVTTAGIGYCWGWGLFGALGNGMTEAHEPQPVSGSESWVRIDAGEAYSCGVTAAGEGFCWGMGGAGRLGDGAEEHRSLPTAVAGGHEWREIRTSRTFTCGVTTDDEARCWGSGYFGDGFVAQKSREPIPAGGGRTWRMVDPADLHACGVTRDDRAWCWGEEGSGEIGDGGGGVSVHLDPIQPAGGRSFRSVASLRFHSCGITTAGEGFCWGVGSDGRLGYGGTETRAEPTAVAGGHDWSLIDVGRQYSCGVRSDGRAFCWGDESSGELGNGEAGPVSEPTPVADPSGTDSAPPRIP